MPQKKNHSDIDFEIQFYENILKRKPDFAEALLAIGELYTKKGLYEKGLEIDKKLLQLRPDDAAILYNLACSYSLLNRVDDAFSTIKSAIRCGYNDLDYLMKDDDLTNLRQDNRFQEFFAQIKKKPAHPQ